MEDELDDKIIYQIFVSHMKLVSRLTWGLPFNFSPLCGVAAYIWRMLRLYVLKPETMVVSAALILIVVIYMRAVDLWSRNLLGKFHVSLNKSAILRAPYDAVRLGSLFSSKLRIPGPLSLLLSTLPANSTWELAVGPVAVFALRGRRPRMEDRYVVNGNINNDTGVSLFAVFDGHGGEFAANYAKEHLTRGIYKRVIEVQDIINGRTPTKPPAKETDSHKSVRKSSIRRPATDDDHAKVDSSKPEITDAYLLAKLSNLKRPITRELGPMLNAEAPLNRDTSDYLDPKSKLVNYRQLITDEVLAVDHSLLEVARKSFDVAGTTALLAMVVADQSALIVANVGDSRAVMCDSRGVAIPLSFDHKPQQERERERIKKAGGFVAFNGVWRVAGILATSRAMGDYPLKERRLVIADPDVYTFDLAYHKPSFVILATDGLWDTLTNEQAVRFIQAHLHEPDYGARALALHSYSLGSFDNITVIIIRFKNGVLVNATGINSN